LQFFPTITQSILVCQTRFSHLILSIQQFRKGKKASIDPSVEDDNASPLVLAVASSPRVSRKRLGSNTVVTVPSSNDASRQDDSLLGS
jgi:hypothetical protein